MMPIKLKPIDWVLALSAAITIIGSIAMFDLRFYHTRIAGTKIIRTDTTPEVGIYTAITVATLSLIFSGAINDRA